MENYTSNSGSRSQSCPFKRFNVWEEDSIPDSVRYNNFASVIMNSTASPCITAANICVCWSIFKTQAMRRNNYKLLLAFLALTDLLIGAVAQPLYIASRICRLNPECDPCIPDLLSDFFNLILLSVSYYHVVLLSGERYLAIQHALRYNALLTSNNLMCAVAVAWLLSLLSSLSYYFVSNGTWNLVFLPWGCVSSSFLVYCNICILIESKRHHRIIAAQVSTLTKQENARQSVASVSSHTARSGEFKAVKTTALIVGVFLVSPFLFVAIVAPITFLKDSLPSTPIHITLEWTATLVRLNSLVNPLLYCWRISEIRRVCYDNIHKILCISG